MKKFKFLALLIAAVCLVFPLVGCCTKGPAAQIKNVVLIIGDGMGFNHVENAKKLFGLDNLIFEKDFFAQSKTHSASSGTTDSAAGATAMATGHKVNNGEISRTNGQNLQSIVELAQAQGMKTGILTNDNLYGATPAAFSSHVDARTNTQEIILQQTSSNINLLIGKSNSQYNSYQTQFVDSGYTMVQTFDALKSTTSDKVIANLRNIRSIYDETKINQTDMSEVAKFALEFLQNDNGFFLMIEEGYIDKNAHNNELQKSLCETRTLFDIVEKVYRFCKNRKDTMVIVTADHETGGLQLSTDGNFNNSLFSTTKHTSANVPIYVKNPVLKTEEAEVENTTIFEMCKKPILN